MPKATRTEEFHRWFMSNVWNVPERRSLLQEALEGDNRWLNKISKGMYPKRAREGQPHRDFCHHIRRAARSFLAAHPEHQLRATMPAKNNGKEEDIAERHDGSLTDNNLEINHLEM